MYWFNSRKSIIGRHPPPFLGTTKSGLIKCTSHFWMGTTASFNAKLEIASVSAFSLTESSVKFTGTAPSVGHWHSGSRYPLTVVRTQGSLVNNSQLCTNRSNLPPIGVSLCVATNDISRSSDVRAFRGGGNWFKISSIGLMVG